MFRSRHWFIMLSIALLTLSALACNQGGRIRNVLQDDPSVAVPPTAESAPTEDTSQEEIGVQPEEDSLGDDEIPGDDTAAELEALLDELISASEAEDRELEGLP